MTCAKQTVTARLVTTDGEEFIGTNACAKPQEKCPRDDLGYPSGEGYHLCHHICEQRNHAEVAAIRLAGRKKTQGAIIYLTGHTYACDDCKGVADSAGISQIAIVKDEEILG